MANTGRVVQVIGPVLDVEFDPEHLPEIYNALTIKATNESGQEIDVVAEVQQHIGRGQVRAVAMSSTDGVTRGMEMTDAGTSITVPVGEAALGRILNVLGEPVDEQGPVGGGADVERWPIHRAAPKFDQLEPKTEIFETGIKVIDLLAPYVKGGKTGLFGGAGSARRSSSRSSSTTSRPSTVDVPCSAAWVSARAKETTSGSSSKKPACSTRPHWSTDR